MFDVAVVGAGPAGSMLARILGVKGYSVVLLEKHPCPGDEVNCSGIIGVEAFQHFDLPTDHILRVIDQLRFISPGGVSLPFQHPDPLAYAVNRARFDAAMAARAVASGAILRTGAHVDEIQINQSDVTLSVNRNQSVVKSRFVVLATGAGSRLLQQVGLSGPKKFVLGAQTECDITEAEEIEVYLGHRVAPSNFGWLIPLQKGRAKVGLICDRQAPHALRKFMESEPLRDRIRSRAKIRCSLLPLDTIHRSYGHRTIVVGEAAGQLKTITCGGIYYALLAAEIGADVLDRALQHHQSDAATLAPYEQRWRDLLEAELRIGLRLRSLFGRLSDDRINTLFEVAAKDGLMDIIREKVNFDWHRDLVNAMLRHSLVRATLRPAAYSRLLF